MRAVGESLDDGWALAERFERDARGVPDPVRSEFWIVRIVEARVAAVWSTRTSLWGFVAHGFGAATFASREASSGVVQQADGLWVAEDGEEGIAITHVDVGASFRGLASASDGRVLAWGSSGSPALVVPALRWLSGNPLSDNEGGMHLAPASLAIAGSREGTVSIFDGAAWSTPVTLGLPPLGIAAVGIAARDEAYAATIDPLAIHRFDGDRWHVVMPDAPQVHAFEAYGGTMYAATRAGLMRLTASGTERIDGFDGAIALHAGARLLLTSDESIADTDLGAERRLSIAELAEVVADRTPLWRTRALDSRRAFSAPLPTRPSFGDPERLVFGSAVRSERHDDTIFIGVRSEDWNRPELDEQESFVGRAKEGLIHELKVHAARITEVGRSPSGTTYLSVWSAKAGLWRSRPGGSFAWERFNAPPLDGLFVLNDECVIAWGGSGKGQAFFLFDGQHLRRIGSPPERTLRVHGCAPDFLVAVGHHGMIARWDGERWRECPTPVTGVLGSILVLSPQAMYATGPCGVFLEGTEHGWIERAPTSGAAVDIASFYGDVYVGDMVLGLRRLEGPNLVPVDLPVWPANLDATETALTMMESERLVWTTDLVATEWLDLDDLRLALRDVPPGFRRRR